MSNPNVSSVSEANEQYRTAMELKSRGQLDTALTWFRRAAITDPTFVGALIEIGRICKDKARLDRMFLRYAFEAYRNAARLDFTLQEAHDNYILLGQQMGILDQIHDEYEAWAKQNPDNDVLQRCYKNVVAISMAIFSPQVQVGQVQASNTIKKMIFAFSFLTLLFGAGLIFIPAVFAKDGKITKEQIRSFFKVGIVLCVAGLGGLLYHRRLD